MFNSGQGLSPERVYNLPGFGKLKISLLIFSCSLMPLFFLRKHGGFMLVGQSVHSKIMPQGNILTYWLFCKIRDLLNLN